MRGFGRYCHLVTDLCPCPRKLIAHGHLQMSEKPCQALHVDTTQPIVNAMMLS